MIQRRWSVRETLCSKVIRRWVRLLQNLYLVSNRKFFDSPQCISAYLASSGDTIFNGGEEKESCMQEVDVVCECMCVGVSEKFYLIYNLPYSFCVGGCDLC